MRYILETTDEQGLIGIQIKKWEEDGKLKIIEKAEPVVELQTQLDRIARALEILRKSGYNSEVMKTWVRAKTGLGLQKINAVLDSQEEFFRQIGVIKE
jgi:hypothetical protein